MLPFDTLTLSTARLHLRPLVETDADGLWRVFSDPEVTRYWSSPPWESVARGHALIARDRVGMRAGEVLRLGLERRADGELLGFVTLFAFNDQCRRAELGYVLGRSAWGQGYMREALVALLDHGFTTLGLHRVEADTDPRNLASRRLLEQLGFVLEGTLRERWIVGDEISDTSLYGLLARDWRGAGT